VEISEEQIIKLEELIKDYKQKELTAHRAESERMWAFDSLRIALGKINERLYGDSELRNFVYREREEWK